WLWRMMSSRERTANPRRSRRPAWSATNNPSPCCTLATRWFQPTRWFHCTSPLLMVAILCCGGCGGCGSPTAPPVRRDPKAEAEFKKLAEVNSVDLSRLVGSWQVVTRFDNGEQTRKGV